MPDAVACGYCGEALEAGAVMLVSKRILLTRAQDIGLLLSTKRTPVHVHCADAWIQFFIHQHKE